MQYPATIGPPAFKWCIIGGPMVPRLHVYWAITRSFFVFYEFMCQVGNHEVAGWIIRPGNILSLPAPIQLALLSVAAKRVLT